MSGASTMTPKAWKHLLWSLVLLAVLIPLWVLLLMTVIQPEPLMTENQSMSTRLWWWVAGPVLAVGLLVGWRWTVAQSKAGAEQPAPQQAPAQATGQASEAAKEQVRREYVLEVIGLGVSLDKYRQGKLWDVLSKGHAYASVREQDPKKYPWSADDKDGMEGGRVNDAMENGARALPTYWGTPAFAGSWGPKDGIDRSGNVMGSPSISGMGNHLLVGADGQEGERTDRVLERVFLFFDEHPEVPYIIVSSADGMSTRDLLKPKDTPPLVRDGYYIPERTTAAALFVLARRDRVDRMRPYAFDDFDESKEQINMDELNRQGFGRRLYLTYLELSKRLPKPSGYLYRAPTVTEWLQETDAFAKRDDIYPKDRSFLDDTLHKNKRPPKDFKPTPWFPIPWSKVQLRDFDRLPTLGFIHRPVFVKTIDEQGKPLSRRDARAAALAAGWNEALQTLPEAERKAAPARVAVGSAGNVEQTIALTTVLNGWAEHGGPELDQAKPTQWIDTDARLGNTGAATWFTQMAIGVMGSYIEGGTSAAINLRDPSEASIIFITPPPADKRQAQAKWDVFKHRVTPAVDPANYKQP
jgi:hypothetical protein